MDDHLQTSHPHVWAAGDVADHQDKLYGQKFFFQARQETPEGGCTGLA